VNISDSCTHIFNISIWYPAHRKSTLTVAMLQT
jgi:hypothetical protein